MSFNKPTPVATPQKIDLKNWSRLLVGTYKKDDKGIEDSLSNSIARFEKLTPNFKKNSKVLILSEGHSFLPIYFGSKFGSKITVICRNEQSIKGLEKDIKNYELEANVTVAKKDYHMTQYDYDQFDMIWSVNMLYSEVELLSVLREMRRILVPQGRFILCEMTSEDEKVQEDMKVYSIKNIEREANKADLEKVYLKEFVKESKDHYKYLSNKIDERKKGNQALTDITDLVNEDKLVWTFMQFQKRNA